MSVPPPFLSGDGFVLTALAPGDAALLPPASEGEEVAFAARDEAGRLLGVVVVGAIDWPTRSGIVSWRAAPGEARWGDRAATLASRYALYELGLLELRADDAPADALAALGLAPSGPWWRRADPAPFTPPPET